MKALIGQKDGADVTVTIDQTHIARYVGGMRIVTEKKPGFTASPVGVYKAEG